MLGQTRDKRDSQNMKRLKMFIRVKNKYFCLRVGLFITCKSIPVRRHFLTAEFIILSHITCTYMVVP